MRARLLLAFAAAVSLWPTIASATPFTNPGFESGNFSGWNVTAVPPGAPAIAIFETVAGVPSLAASLPFFPGPGNFGTSGMDLTQAVVLLTAEYLHIRANVAAATDDTNFFVSFAPIVNGGTFGAHQPNLYFFPPATGIIRDAAEGVVFAPAGTYEIGFRLDVSVSGPLGAVGGIAYLDNASFLATMDPPVDGIFDCTNPLPATGAFGCPISATPEPATLLLFGTTALGLGLARWKS